MQNIKVNSAVSEGSFTKPSNFHTPSHHSEISNH